MKDRFAFSHYQGERHKGRRIATIWSNTYRDSGDVTLADWFDALLPIEKLDLLSDAIALMQSEYQTILDEQEASFRKARGLLDG